MKKLILSLVAVFFVGVVFADARYVTTGAELSTDGDDEIYTWTDTNVVGTIVVPEGGALFDILLVGGGGAGGWCRGGGGGGGGVVYQTGVFFPEGTYSIAVGAGGVPDVNTKSYGAPASTERTNGRPSTVSNATSQVRIAYGGGGGATYNDAGRALVAGASSGGAAGSDHVAPEVSGTQGYRGGASDNDTGGGGGGAGGPGSDANSKVAGNGGIGFLCGITGSDIRYGGGGGGGTYAAAQGVKGGLGGEGGGGHGGCNANADLTSGVDGLGGGGGGASGHGNNVANCGGASGGNGIVIFRTAAASRPVFTPVEVSVKDGTNVTFTSTLQGMGTNPEGSASATGCDLYFAYGTDPDNLVSGIVKSGWNLDDHQWTMTVSDIPAYSRFYWRAAMTNDLDVGSEDEFSGSFYTTGALKAVPLKATFTDPTVGASVSGDTQLGDAFALTDGTTTYYSDLGNGGEGNIYPVTLDAGEPKTVRLLRVFIPLSVANDRVPVRLADMELYGSNDKETWTKLMDVNDFLIELKSNAWLESLLASSGPFRYFEIRGVKAISMSEVQLLAEDMGLKQELPKFLASTDLECGDDHEGVTVSGTLTYSPSAETEVYGYYAAADYDADESAWAANGTKFVFDGVYKTGDAFSRKVKMSGYGERFIRLFAKADEKKTSSHRTWMIALKTQAKLVPAYYYDTYAIKPGKTFYDASLAYQGSDIGNGAELIFDLRGLKPSEELSFIRFWPRTGGQTWLRARTGKIAVSYDDVDFVRSGESAVSGREVFLTTGVDGGKTITWKTVKGHLDELLPLSNQIVSGWQFLNLPADERRPTYLRISSFTLGNLNEAELRVVAPPPGMTIFYR